MKKEEKQLIDRFLLNTLTGSELQDFHDKMENDQHFRKQVSFNNLLFDSIQEAEDERLEKEIVASLNYKKPSVPFALKLIVTFLAICGTGIILWNYLGTETTILKQDYFSFMRPRQDQEINQAEKQNTTINSTRKGTIKPIIEAADSLNESNSELNNAVATSDSTEIEEAEEIVVRKDQLLISIPVKPIDLSHDSIPGDELSLASNIVSEALNPAADLPNEGTGSNDTYIVEFWVSPVNYIGYKLISRKLILFGIEEPDAVQLIKAKDKLWLKYGHEYYKLDPSEEFSSLRVSSEKPAYSK